MSVVSKELQAVVLEKLRACVIQAEKKLNMTIPMPQLVFNQRGKLAGSAHLQKHLIKINPVLLLDNQQTFMEEVIPHELCHLIAFQLYGRVRPHGFEWRSLMKEVFNLTPSSYHQMETSKVQGRTFSYFCGCGEIKLGIRRHNKIVRNQAQYHCKTCNQTLSKAQ